MDPTQPLGRFLPQLHSIAEPPDGCLLDVFGQPMPPCIIMEKGEAMDVWVDKSGEDMDMFTGLQACYQCFIETQCFSNRDPENSPRYSEFLYL